MALRMCISLFLLGNFRYSGTLLLESHKIVQNDTRSDLIKQKKGGRGEEW